VIAARNEETMEKVVEEIKSINPQTTVLSVKTDIVSESDVSNLYTQVQKRFGRHADVLLNNAGYLQDEQLIGETPVEDWWKGIVSPCTLLQHGRWS
jgi:NADP-dependent 3-hydroxy acid dehydrogenase YdfG